MWLKERNETLMWLRQDERNRKGMQIMDTYIVRPVACNLHFVPHEANGASKLEGQSLVYTLAVPGAVDGVRQQNRLLPQRRTLGVHLWRARCACPGSCKAHHHHDQHSKEEVLHSEV